MDQSYLNPDGWHPPMAPKPKPNLAPPAGITGNVNVLDQGASGGASPENDYGYSAYAKALGAIPPSPTLEQPTYQEPKKTGQIIATALSVLFPGAPISKLAAGYLSGTKNKADEDYARAQQADAAKYNAAEQTRQDAAQQADAAGKQYDAQMRLEQQRESTEQNFLIKQEAAEAAKERNRIAQENARTNRLREQSYAAYNIGRLQEFPQKLAVDWAKVGLENKKLGITSDYQNRRLAEVIRKDNMTTATALARGQMTEDIAASKQALTASMFILNQAGIDRRFAATTEFKKANMASQNLNKLTASQLAAVAKDTSLNDDDKAAKNASIVRAAQDKFAEIATSVVAVKPELGAVFDQAKATAQTLASQSAQEELATEAGGTSAGGAQPTVVNNYIGQGGEIPDIGGRYQTAYSQVAGEGGAGGTSGKMPPTPLLQNLEKLQLSIGATPQEARYLAIIAANESGGDPSIIGHKDPDDMGLWQINKKYHGDGNWLDPITNAKEALKLFRASGFRDWTASKDQGQYGGWGAVIGQVPGDPAASRSFMDPNYDYTKPHGAAPAAAPGGGEGGAPPVALKPPGPREVEKIKQLVNAPNVTDEVIVQAFARDGFAVDPAMLKNLRHQRDAAPPIEQGPDIKAPPSPPAAPQTSADRMRAANAGKGVDLAGLVQVGGQSPAARNYRQPATNATAPNPLKALAGYLAAPPPPGTYQPPSPAEKAPTSSAASTAPAGLTPQAQALQEQKIRAAIPQAQALIRRSIPPQQILRMLEGRGLTPSSAQQVLAQVIAAVK